MLFRILLGCFCCRTPCHVTTKKWVTKQSRTFLWYSHSSVCFAVAINLFRDMCPHVLQIHKLLFSVGLEWTKFRNSRTLSAKCRDQGPRSARPDTCVYPWLCWYCPFVQIVAQASSQSSQKLEAEKDKDPSENYANINQSNKFQQHWALLLLNHEKFKKNPVQAPDKPGQKHEGKAEDRIYIQVKCEWIIVVGGTQNVLVTTKWQHETQLGAGNSRLQGVHSPVQNLKTWGRTELMDSNQNAALPKQIYMNQHHPVVCHAMSYFCLCNFPCSSLATKKACIMSPVQIKKWGPKLINHQGLFVQFNMFQVFWLLHFHTWCCVQNWSQAWLQQLRLHAMLLLKSVTTWCLQSWTKQQQPLQTRIIALMHMPLDTMDVITRWTLSFHKCSRGTAAAQMDIMLLASKSTESLGRILMRWNRKEMALNLMIRSSQMLLTPKQRPMTPKWKKVNSLVVQQYHVCAPRGRGVPTDQLQAGFTTVCMTGCSD